MKGLAVLVILRRRPLYSSKGSRMTDPTEHERAGSTSGPEEETTLQLKGFKND